MSSYEDAIRAGQHLVLKFPQYEKVAMELMCQLWATEFMCCARLKEPIPLPPTILRKSDDLP